MRRLAVALSLMGAAPAAAQQLYINALPGDSASVILTGDTGSVSLQVYTACLGLSAYAVRLYFDSDRLTVVAADSVPGNGFARPARTDGTDYVELSAAGSSADCYVDVATVRFLLDANATTGSLLSLRALTLTSAAAADLLPAHEVFLGQICQAVDLWGDTDGSRTVTSLDALVLLTAAVGLPTGGMSLASGDIDDDGHVTTRDALFALSEAIGLFADRAGDPRVNRCAPLAPAPADAAFYADGAVWYIAAGDTVPVRLGGSPDGSYRPTWKPDGTRVLFTDFVSGGGNEFISMQLDGTADTIAVSPSYEYAPSWSPDGLLIAFTSDRHSPRPLLVMDPTGAGQDTLAMGDSLYVYETEWTPDGAEIVFTAYANTSCCSRRLWAIQPGGGGLREVFPNSAALQPRDPAVSPAGDSVVFRSAGDGRLYVVPLAGGAAATRIGRLGGLQSSPQWVSAGIAFRSDLVFPYGFYYQRPDGRILRFAHGGVGSTYQMLRLRRP